jgi:hypothetical protein
VTKSTRVFWCRHSRLTHKVLAFAFAAITPLAVQAQNIITTVAGGGPNSNPSAVSASIGSATAVVQDGLGNTYTLDNDFCRVYKINASGNLSVYAGNGSCGYGGDGGPATSGQIDGGNGLAVDTAGNLYIADTANEAIRVVAATNTTLFGISMTAGNIYTVAGTGNSGFSIDGTAATSANLADPQSVFVDKFGNLFIADSGNQRIRVVAAANTTLFGVTMNANDIYTVAGNGTSGFSIDGAAATAANLASPQSVFVDPFENLFISDSGNQQIRVVAAANTTLFGVTMNANDIYTVAGNGTSGFSIDGTAATSASLASPQSVFVDPSGNLFLCDTGNQLVRVVPAINTTLFGVAVNANDIYTVAGGGSSGGTGDGASATNATLVFPQGVFMDTHGNLLIADANDARLREVAAVAANGMTVGDIYTLAGNGYDSYSGDGGTPNAAQLNNPSSAYIYGTGDLFIADSGSNVIREVPVATGKIQTLTGNGVSGYAGDGGPANGTGAELNFPSSAFVDKFGNVFIADLQNCVVREIAATTGNGMTAKDIYTVAGTDPDSGGAHCGYGGDGARATAPGAQLNIPIGVFVDGSGNLFIVDADNCVIREVAGVTGNGMVAGNIYTVAGSDPDSGGAHCGYGGDFAGATASGALLNFPGGLFVDGAGNLFIADTHNEIVREVPAANTTMFGIPMTKGNLYTVAGTPGNANYGGDFGPATGAKLFFPYDVLVDGSGNLFISDNNNCVIREVANVTGNGMSLGNIYTVAGTVPDTNGPHCGYGGDGANSTASSALLSFPLGIAAGPEGSLLIADSGNNVIRSVSGLLNEPWLNLSATSLTFTAQAEGTSSKQMLTLTNVGTTPLTINSLTVNGPNGADFTEKDTCTNNTLGGGAACTATVTYAPSVTGAEQATLTITDTANGPLSVSLGGTGVTVTATLSSGSLAFGNQLVGTPATEQSATLTNNGTGTLMIGAIAVGGSDPGDFVESDDCGGSVAAGAHCSINVTFTPAATGSRTATISINDSAPTSPQTISLSGEGIGASMSLALNGAATQTVAAGKTATYSLQLTATGGPATQFSATIGCTGAPAMASCTASPSTVTATPATPGMFSITVTTTGTGGGMIVPSLPSTLRTQPPGALRMLPLAVLALLLAIAAVLASGLSSAGRLRIVRVALSACFLLLTVSGAMLLVGCANTGSSSSAPGSSVPTQTSSTPAGTYTLTVTATAGGKTQTAALTLVVQ